MFYDVGSISVEMQPFEVWNPPIQTDPSISHVYQILSLTMGSHRRTLEQGNFPIWKFHDGREHPCKAVRLRKAPKRDFFWEPTKIMFCAGIRAWNCCERIWERDRTLLNTFRIQGTDLKPILKWSKKSKSFDSKPFESKIAVSRLRTTKLAWNLRSWSPLCWNLFRLPDQI